MDDPCTGLVMELLPRGDLSAYLTSNGKLSESMRRYLHHPVAYGHDLTSRGYGTVLHVSDLRRARCEYTPYVLHLR